MSGMPTRSLFPGEFLFATFFSLFSPSLFLCLFFSHSFLCLSGKARNVTELRPFWRPSLRSTSLNRYATSTLKAIHFTLNRIAANQRTRNALFSRLLATDSKLSRLSSIYIAHSDIRQFSKNPNHTNYMSIFYNISISILFFSNIFYCAFCI